MNVFQIREQWVVLEQSRKDYISQIFTTSDEAGKFMRNTYNLHLINKQDDKNQSYSRAVVSTYGPRARTGSRTNFFIAPPPPQLI